MMLANTMTRNKRQTTGSYHTDSSRAVHTAHCGLCPLSAFVRNTINCSLSIIIFRPVPGRIQTCLNGARPSESTAETKMKICILCAQTVKMIFNVILYSSKWPVLFYEVFCITSSVISGKTVTMSHFCFIHSVDLDWDVIPVQNTGLLAVYQEGIMVAVDVGATKRNRSLGLTKGIATGMQI